MVQLTKAQQGQWKEEGYLVVEEAYEGEDLKRLQEAFDRCSEEARPQWLKGVETGTQPAAFFDIPTPLEKDDAFIDLADHSSYFGLLMDLLGEDLVFHGAQVRTLPLSPISYVGWHPDIPHTQPQHIKVQVYVDDVPPNGGAFAYVPGSHQPNADPCPVVHQLERMPGHKVFPGKAGTAILFSTYGWHTSMVNKSQRPRKSIILGYSGRHEDKYDPQRYAEIADRLTTAQRRKLFCLESYSSKVPA
jgi:ectoine hydroxylase-related dioxygenase (phytanoyl-CoA dioxygenase family)